VDLAPAVGQGRAGRRVTAGFGHALVHRGIETADGVGDVGEWVHEREEF
jgi:hypothetical protein